MNVQPMTDAKVLSPHAAFAALNVLMVYEDLATGHRVMRVFDALQHRFHKAIQFHTDMWKLDILSCPSMGRMAAQDARDADLILVSVHSPELLPEAVQNWFKHGVAQRGRNHGTLIALLSTNHSETAQVTEPYAFLEHVASEARMDFSVVLMDEGQTDMPVNRVASDIEEPPPVLENACRKYAHPQVDLVHAPPLRQP
ncbi:MAG: hypothetical protein HZA90_15095 [Verrucomicrobia bacterium]|nr:hypothetical protein [Verrucomicrobiota bacterium]